MAFDALFGIGGIIRRVVAKTRTTAGGLSHQRTIILLTLTFCGAVATTLWHMSRLSSNLIESAALQGTILYSETLTELRNF